MVSVIRPSRLTRQPQGVPKLSLASPLRRGLISYMPLTGRGYGDIADGTPWTPTGPVAYEGAARGMALRVKGATASYLSRSTPSALAGGIAPPLTFAFRLSLRAIATNSGIMSWGTGAQDGAPRFYVRVSGGSLNIYYGGSYQVSIPVAVGGEYILMHVWDGGSQFTYFGGALIASRVAGFGGNNSSLYLGTGFDGVNSGTDYLLSDFGAWNRALTSGEAASYAQNPWALFDSGSGGSAYLTALASAAASNGTTANVNPDAAALALTGYAPTVDRGAAVAMSPAAAALSIAGYVPSVLQPHAVAPGIAAMSIAGYAPSITQGATTNVVPAAGALSLTGYAPAVTQGLAQNIALTAASITITGYLPTVAQSAVRSAAPGNAAISITGYAPTVVRGASLNLPIGAAAGLVLTGYAPTISQAVGIPLAPGHVAITGYAPKIEQAIVVTSQPCALGITGYAPSVHLMRSFLNVPAPASRTITLPKQDRTIMLKRRPNKIRM